jgi:DNA mismatch endonuclease, patch repair protein
VNVDVMTSAQRSRCMSKIRGTDTGPETTLRKALWARGLRYRLRSKLPGKPDLVFMRQRVVVFVDGCFWHACPKHATRPKTNAKFWREKIGRNVQRDREVELLLGDRGWVVLRFWEHEVAAQIANVVAAIELELSRVRI